MKNRLGLSCPASSSHPLWPLGPAPKKHVRQLSFQTTALLLRDSLGARTQDPNIKSVVLYLLS